MLRNEFSESEARSRIEAQMGTELKLKFATDIIDNSGSLEDLYKQVDALSEKLGRETSWINRVTVGFVLCLVAYAGYRALF